MQRRAHRLSLPTLGALTPPSVCSCTETLCLYVREQLAAKSLGCSLTSARRQGLTQMCTHGSFSVRPGGLCCQRIIIECTRCRQQGEFTVFRQQEQAGSPLELCNKSPKTMTSACWHLHKNTPGC